jgi:hypothetical protein
MASAEQAYNFNFFKEVGTEVILVDNKHFPNCTLIANNDTVIQNT